jgi:hypothetical protein
MCAASGTASASSPPLPKAGDINMDTDSMGVDMKMRTEAEGKATQAKSRRGQRRGAGWARLQLLACTTRPPAHTDAGAEQNWPQLVARCPV